MTPTAEKNILRHLAELYPGLERSIVVFQAPEWKRDPSRVYAWPVGTTLYDYCKSRGWNKDAPPVAKVFHGDVEVSFREPGDVWAALQICFKNAPPEWDYGKVKYLEIDHDYRSPYGGLKGLIVHAVEVLVNTITRGKTCQKQIARMLDERFSKKD